MKKIATLILALVLVLSLATTAFAETAKLEAKGAEQTIDVKAKYEDQVNDPTVYSVDLEWGAMEFTYAKVGNHVWQPSDHSYSGTTDNEWQASGNTVKATNHSNADVTVEFAFAAEDGFSVTGDFDVDSWELAAGVVDAYDAADTVTATLTLGGTLADSVANLTKVGTVTVTLK